MPCIHTSVPLAYNFFSNMTQIINIMASSRLFVFLLVFSGHFLIILIGVLSNPINDSISADSQKIKLRFITQVEKTKVKEVTKTSEAKFEPKTLEIKKKPKLVRKKKINKTSPKLTKKIDDDEPIAKIKDNKSQDEVAGGKLVDSFKDVKTPLSNNSHSKDLSKKQIKTRARIGGDITQCKPNYPRTSKRRGEQGTVILRFLINEEGKAEKAEIKQTSGYKRLDNAAKAGLFSCKFIPASVDGTFIKDWAVIPYVFQLK